MVQIFQSNILSFIIVLSSLCFPLVSADIFDHFFNSGRQQQQARYNQPISKEQEILHNKCDNYLCKDTLACVKSPVDCPCELPASQVKCILPGNKDYVCISKSDNSIVGNEARDCKFVEKAWKGLV
ncbi:hypothetical protein PACTADRAFT_51799 [Pachysolen tannophilus NRRL Y-2460]|uniref:Long chronological lifespan protein 2 n=1 Tax=Pachysolen tannophilus NRRL Y-2460 TaxID=669874 RepID=A0A1E4TND2_PACTA|nr:hypothetical protein PACTADRAFT_51799 [Pachysolen tannophilus NRRL Y-2460]